MKRRFYILAYLLLSIILVNDININAMKPITTDSRIRTLVYNENEVFKLITFYGYQSNIELGKNERIKTVSLGDPTPFKVTPEKNRMFIKATRDEELTNMTVITDKRVYQFELSSKKDDGDESIYVMRFYYPEDKYVDTRMADTNPKAQQYQKKLSDIVAQKILVKKNNLENLNSSKDFSAAHNMNVNKKLPLQKPIIDELRGKNIVADDFGFDPENMTSTAKLKDNNYNYSLVGNKTLSPKKVFDDGNNTYIDMGKIPLPQFRSILKKRVGQPFNIDKFHEYVVIQGVHKHIGLFWSDASICVINENIKN